MEPEFILQVGKALELVRKYDFSELGSCELASLTLLRRAVSPGDPPLEVGRKIRDILRAIVEEQMKPEGPPVLDRKDWRNYTLLHEYIFRGRSWGEVAIELIIGQAMFFQIKRSAIEQLASELWLEESRAQKEVLEIPNNIPRSLYDFVPRADENGRNLVDVALEGLRRRPWVVSIRGFGGTGKTTLAIEVAWAAIRQDMFDQVVWVAISPRQAKSADLPMYIFTTIARELKDRRVLSLEDWREASSIVLNLLQDKRYLLAFDSTEDVPLDYNAVILDFIKALPMPVCALIVSREMTRKTELETMVHLKGMREEEALEFLRARAQEQGIRLSDEDMRYLYEMTQGNPKAMLWALGTASRLSLSVKEVFEPVIRRNEKAQMDVLVNDILARVYDSLDEHEERLLNAISIFSLPAPLPAIIAASNLSSDPTGLEGLKIPLGGLHSRFLVDRMGEDRYAISPITQMFLQDRAVNTQLRMADMLLTDFLEEAHRRLADFYIAHLRHCEQYARIEYVREYGEDILRTMEWCHKRNDDQRVTELMSLVGRALGNLGYWNHRLIWGRRAIEASQRLGNAERALWHAIYDVAWAHISRGEYPQAEMVTREGLEKAKGLNYPQLETIAHQNLGDIAFEQGDYKVAEEQYRKALAMAQAQDMSQWAAQIRSSLGRLKVELGEAPEARKLFEQAYAVRHLLEDPSEESLALSELALAHFGEGNFVEATTLLDRSLLFARKTAPPSRAYAYLLQVRGLMLKGQGSLDEAKESLEESHEIWTRLGAKARAERVRRLLDDLTTDRI